MKQFSQSHSMEMIQNDLEESEILNQRFLELLNSQQVVEHSSDVNDLNFPLTEDEEEEIKQRFIMLTGGKETMDYSQFRNSLGLLGREDPFISRIFRLIDQDGLGVLTEDDYIKYIRTVIHGSDFDRQLFGWKIFSGGRDEISLKDLFSLFEEISIIWNTMTGDIVQPKKKYIEELFNILDIDQDDVITFQDYRVFYKVQPILFGWFEYLNNMDINQKVSKVEMEKTKNILQVNTFSINHTFKTGDEIKTMMETQERKIESKMNAVMQEISSSINFGYEKIAFQEVMKNSQSVTDSQKPSNLAVSSASSIRNSSLSNLSTFGKYFDFQIPVNQQAQNGDKHEEQISRIKRRKEKLQVQESKETNNELVKYLQQIMDKCYKAMNACGEYRELQNLSQKYSPSKLRLKEAKMLAVQEKGTEEKKKKNVQVYFGHPSWNLVLNLMVGLRKSIRSLYELNTFLQLKSSHFSEQHEFLLGSKALNGKSKEVYKFIEIAPVVFEKLRQNYGISNLQYQKSVGPETLLTSLMMGNLTALNEKCSTGKSGSFFYLTIDSEIFLKTIPKHEFLFFTTILQNYYKHHRDYQNTLIVRIYGLYKLKVYQNKEKVNTIYFISMENIFKDMVNDPKKTIKVKQTYDLKGSLYGRSGTEDKELKDNDWIDRKRKINLPKEVKEIYKNQIKVDSKYFKHNNINDYSLMVTIAEMDLEIWKEQKDKKSQKNIFKTFMGGVLGEKPGEFYILSIIDILTVFEMKKKFEYAIKSTFLSKDVSCIPPNEYCKRFRDFMLKAVEDQNEADTNNSD